MNLADYLLRDAVPGALALVTETTQHTYADVIRAADGVARALAGHGVAKGDRVGIFGDNSLFWVASYLGALKLGAVAVPYYPTMQPEQFKALAAKTGCRVFCAHEKYLKRYADGLPEGAALVVEDEATRERHAARFPVTVATPGDPVATVDVDEKRDLAALMFTSGSTGEPRAVMVSHRNIIANTAGIIEYLGLTAADRTMDVLPFYYCFGTSLLHTHLRAGAALVVNNRFAFPQLVLNQMESTGCTGIAGVPSTFQILLRSSNLKKRELPALRTIQQAGGKLPDVFIRELREALPHARYFLMYGQTEATARLSYLPPERLDTKMGSIGKGMPGVELAVLDADGRPVPVGETGEIVARGDNITLGYWQDPESTAQTYRDGALWTGDLARVDDDGYIFVVDRAKDFIKPSGHRTGTREIEGYIVAWPDVVECAVIGVADDVLGEVAKAYVVLRRGATCTAEDIVAHCKHTMPAYMVPKEVVVLDALPKNAYGKVIKPALRAMHAEGR